MAKVAIVTPEKRQPAALPEGLSGTGHAEAYLAGDKDPIHTWLHRLGKGERLTVGPMANDCLGYVWEGEVVAGGVRLGAGSSLIAEHGQSIAIEGAGDGDAVVLTFRGAGQASHARAGGHVHLLPAERVPGAADLSGHGVGGNMHSDGQCETCSVWLHENHFGPAEPLPPEQAARGVHSHSEDEVIFIIRGAIRLGQKLFPAGTAVAIAADTMYSIAPGPEGMSFINFRAGMPSDILFASGDSMSETQYWKDRVARPEYLSPLAA
ncbi:MAG: hypothetical protein AB7F98_03430 [Novosphingobium sp.]